MRTVRYTRYLHRDSWETSTPSSQMSSQPTCCSCASPTSPSYYRQDALPQKKSALLVPTRVSPLPYFPVRVRVSVNYEKCGHGIAPSCRGASLISNFQLSSCTLYDGPYRRKTVWLQSTCVLGLQQTTKRRREDYKTWGEHSRKLVNLTLCELL